MCRSSTCVWLWVVQQGKKKMLFQRIIEISIVICAVNLLLRKLNIGEVNGRERKKMRRNDSWNDKADHQNPLECHFQQTVLNGISQIHICHSPYTWNSLCFVIVFRLLCPSHIWSKSRQIHTTQLGDKKINALSENPLQSHIERHNITRNATPEDKQWWTTTFWINNINWK